MATPLNRPPAVSLTLISAAIPHLSRDALEGLVENLIDRLDALDPDPDLEPNGDERDGGMGEDEFVVHGGPERLLGPGCPLADPDVAVDDEPCDEPYQDLEDQQMYDDVPCVPCYAIEPGQEGKRPFLAHWNPGSFVAAGRPVNPD